VHYGGRLWGRQLLVVLPTLHRPTPTNEAYKGDRAPYAGFTLCASRSRSLSPLLKVKALHFAGDPTQAGRSCESDMDIAEYDTNAISVVSCPLCLYSVRVTDPTIIPERYLLDFLQHLRINGYHFTRFH